MVAPNTSTSTVCFTYIIECSDRTFYVGWTNDLNQRLIAHNQGKGAKYTRGRLPVSLVAWWQFPSKSEAMKFELQLKRLSRFEKQKLIGAFKTAGTYNTID